MAFTLRNIIRKASSKLLRKSPKIEDTEEDDKVSMFSAAPSRVRKIQLPKDPDKVRKAKHSSPPLHFPDLNAEQDEIRYFLYTLLTTKELGIYKLYPQWILETCWAWTGNGRQLLGMNSKDLLDICPFSSGYAGIDSAKYKTEDIVPSAARQMIGKALLSFKDQQEQTLKRRRDGEHTQLGNGRIILADSIASQSGTISRSNSARPIPTACSTTEMQVKRHIPRSTRLSSNSPHLSPTSDCITQRTWHRHQSMRNSINDSHVPPSLKLQICKTSYPSVSSSTSPSATQTALSSQYSISTNPSLLIVSTDTFSQKVSPDSSDKSNQEANLLVSDPKSILNQDKAWHLQSSAENKLKAHPQDPVQTETQARFLPISAHQRRVSTFLSETSVKNPGSCARASTEDPIRPHSCSCVGDPISSVYLEQDIYSTQHGDNSVPRCNTNNLSCRESEDAATDGQQQSLEHLNNNVSNCGSVLMNQNPRREFCTESPWLYHVYSPQDMTPSLHPSSGYLTPQSPNRLSLPLHLIQSTPLEPILEGQLQYQNSVGVVEASNEDNCNRISYPPRSIHGLQHMQTMLSTPPPSANPHGSRPPSTRARSLSPTQSTYGASSPSNRPPFYSSNRVAAVSTINGGSVQIQPEDTWRPAYRSISQLVNDSKIDAYALRHGELIAWKSQPNAQATALFLADQEQRGGSDTRMRNRRARSVSTHSNRMHANARESNGPCIRYMDQETGQPRKTLVELIEEKESWSGKAQRGVDRGIPTWHKYR